MKRISLPDSLVVKENSAVAVCCIIPRFTLAVVFLFNVRLGFAVQVEF